MIVINTSNSIPVYEQIGFKFKELIMKDALRQGEKVPSVRELATILTLNPNTISKAYSELEKENVFETIRGSGTYIKNGAKEIVFNSFKAKIKNDLKLVVQDAENFHIDHNIVLEYISEAYKELKGDYNDRS